MFHASDSLSISNVSLTRWVHYGQQTHFSNFGGVIREPHLGKVAPSLNLTDLVNDFVVLKFDRPLRIGLWGLYIEFRSLMKQHGHNGNTFPPYNRMYY